MKKYKLIEKSTRTSSPICWIITERDGGLLVTASLSLKGPDDDEGLLLAANIKETKRGWTINTAWLTSKMVKIFLPREDFYKVQVTV